MNATDVSPETLRVLTVRQPWAEAFAEARRPHGEVEL